MHDHGHVKYEKHDCGVVDVKSEPDRKVRDAIRINGRPMPPLAFEQAPKLELAEPVSAEPPELDEHTMAALNSLKTRKEKRTQAREAVMEPAPDDDDDDDQTVVPGAPKAVAKITEPKKGSKKRPAASTASPIMKRPALADADRIGCAQCRGKGCSTCRDPNATVTKISRADWLKKDALKKKKGAKAKAAPKNKKKKAKAK